MASPLRVLLLVACVGLSAGWLNEADATFTCYVGIYSVNGIQNGSVVNCPGMCASAQTSLPQGNTTAFFCLDPSVCAGLNLGNNCSALQGDSDVRACCCDPSGTGGNNCNIRMAGLEGTITTGSVQVVTDPPIACYTGVWANGVPTSPGSYQVCQGDCVSITMNTTITGEMNNATMYACDPSTVCRNLGILGKCSPIQSGMNGCCCDTDACIDPQKGRIPYVPRVCYAGIKVNTDNFTTGEDVTCDGKCISIETTVQAKKVKVFQCASKAVCQIGLGIEGDACITFESGGTNVTACCCDNADNCNVEASDNLGDKIPIAPWGSSAPLACWNGFYLNGTDQGSAGWASCKGDCASIQWKTSALGDTMTLYTCDPAQVLNDWGVNDYHCGSVGNLSGLTVCSCATSGCLDGTSNVPNDLTDLICAVGVQTGNAFTGQSIYCNGKCASMSTSINGNTTIAYFCADQSVCDTLVLRNKCGPLPGDNDVTGCCCDDADNCNINYSNSTVEPSPPMDVTDPPIACYTGIWINGAALARGVYQACVGDCVSITLNSTVNAMLHTATLYACDPSTVCRQLGILGTCGPISDQMSGCCCNTDDCIDPYKERSPINPLTCYAGVNIPSNNFTKGDDVSCDGKCMSIETTVQNKTVKVFQCASQTVCQTGLKIGGDDCTTFKSGGVDVTACCCDNANNCNVKDSDNLGDKIPIAPWGNSTPLACWNGFYLNGKDQGSAGWANCKGDCASFQWKVTDGGDTMTLYTCDPAQFLVDLGVNENNCSPIDHLSGLKVCSCDRNGCMDGTSNVPNDVANLTCYVGVQTVQSYNGTTINCNGKCGSMSATIQGNLTTAFFCADISICDTLKLRNKCGPVPGDNDVTGCCCDDTNNCNINYANSNINPPTTPAQFTDPPISCYTGLWVNGAPLGPAVYQACQGDCVSIAMNTTIAAVNHTATLFTCDPSTVCRNLGILGDCSSITDGMVGCCCNTDICIDPYKGINPSHPLQCFAGFNVKVDNFTQGDLVACDGKCISVETQVNNKTVKVYQCVQKTVCKDGLLIQDNGCTWLNNGTVYACCCDESSNCNTANDDLDLSKVLKANWTGSSLACWNGFYQDAAAMGAVGWANCNGDCASIQWKTNNTATMTLYTCDPVAFVQQFGVDNTCGIVDDLEGLKVCSCSTSGCLDGTSNVPKLPQTCPSSGSVVALWILLSFSLLTLLCRI